MARSASQAQLLLRTIALRILIGTVVRLLPYRLWRPTLVAALRGSRPGVRDLPYAAAVLSAMANAERLVPLGRCLGRALTGWLLLCRHVPTRLRVDVAWRENRELLAHACLEVDGVALFEAAHCTPATLTNELYAACAAPADSRIGGHSL